MEKYNHQAIEPKWQAVWRDQEAFKTPELNPGDAKTYVLDMFPYPSGSGLHVGHLLGYTGSDVIARVARMQGKKVLHPMGWDAFGLPAENFAIKSGVHPSISTEQNIAEYKRQFSQTGISYDWSKEINTSKPEYYRWTQWLFSVLYKRNLAYRKEGVVNWCPGCQTVLANEQVVSGRCERCGSQVVQKNLKQWYFKITDYAERLLNDLDTLDWPEKIKLMQRNWIGRSEGAQLFFEVKDSQQHIEVFTTRPDTVYGATYLVLAPEHPLVAGLTTPNQQAAVSEYQRVTAEKSELERSFLEKEKTGVFTGAFAINPATKEEIPIWIADYVILSYGTGAIMAVPAHDLRDFEFATQYQLPIIQVVEGAELPLVSKGKLMNSAEFNGHIGEEVLDQLLAKIGGKRQITYRLRDWLVSRQRFWGAPIPILYDQDGHEQLVPDAQLPVELPVDVEFLPTGQSPLTLAEDWKHYQAADGTRWTREVDTLDTFVCSSWYFLRFPTPGSQEAAFDPAAVANWLPVDTYLGGAEHAVLHLLYARFITKVLFDEGYLTFEEPFIRLHNQGMILGPDHNKMSKSKGNVINPDDVVAEYGADTLRTYELFMAPFELEKPWSTRGIVGVRRFLEKVWYLAAKVQSKAPELAELRITHQMVAKVTEDIAALKFNTAVSTMMEAVNALSAQEAISREGYEQLLLVLNPFAPHMTEELWSKLGNQNLCSLAGWPSFDPKYLVEDRVIYPIQINGKIRAKIEVEANLSKEAVLSLAKKQPRVQEMLTGRTVVKEIVVEGRLVSLVLA